MRHSSVGPGSSEITAVIQLCGWVLALTLPGCKSWNRSRTLLTLCFFICKISGFPGPVRPHPGYAVESPGVGGAFGPPSPGYTLEPWRQPPALPPSGLLKAPLRDSVSPGLRSIDFMILKGHNSSIIACFQSCPKLKLRVPLMFLLSWKKIAVKFPPPPSICCLFLFTYDGTQPTDLQFWFPYNCYWTENIAENLLNRKKIILSFVPTIPYRTKETSKLSF